MIPELISSPVIYSANGTVIAILKSTSKSLYSALLGYQRSPVTSQSRWNDIFPVDQEAQQEYWTGIYKSPYRAIRDTKLQSFQFRLIHRFIPCNKFLHNIKIKRTDTCSFCSGTDTIEHFLFQCHGVQVFWKNFILWFNRETDIQLNVSLRAFLFGVPPDTPKAKVINFLLLFFKFFLYRQKLFYQGSLSLIHILQELKTRLRVEKYLTKIEHKPSHFTQWSRIYDALG